MSGAAQGSAATTKAVVDDKSKNGEPAVEKKPAAQLEEDDEFEDFPAEGTQALANQNWTEEDTQIPGGNTHLWEESWDDDDTSDEFAVQLREELKKLGQTK
ncbi:26S proteasome complex subunit [Didymosphaeria variabile]|uniref:26S proteasome complex subunit SEM1 n=1 Tax=Didymosphaeria variabile TaxID=1932322 RepID=A0A9W8XKQ1_9PLEO|nr:26S proteasome complex subunit [Didymosphaeria variabile]KAJ4353351.1 26S proteasome complex subunit [Didymosphaeria variabile]